MANLFNLEKRCFDNIKKREMGSDREMTDKGHKLKGDRFGLACKEKLFPYEVQPSTRAGCF